jgi:hypothetical protein
MHIAGYVDKIAELHFPHVISHAFAVARDKQVFIVTLELFLRWQFLTEGRRDRMNEHAD